MSASKIVDIPSKMEKFYGKGTMLHPSIEEVEALVKMIPKGFVVTIDAIAKQLAKEANTDVTCPMRTGNAIKKISERYSNDNINFDVPFWRVIRSNKMVVKTKNYEFWATVIEKEGFTLSFPKANEIKVEVNDDKVLFFDQ